MAKFNSWMTSTTLIDSIKQRALIPISQNTFTNANLLEFANEEIKMGLLPEIMTLHEELLLHAEEIPLVNNISKYEIPYRAVGHKLRDLAYKDNGDSLFEMTRIGADERIWFQPSQGLFNQFTKYYLENNEIVLVPGVGSNAIGSLLALYYLRPNELVTSDRIATITNLTVSGTNTIITLDQIPDNIRSDITDSSKQYNIIDFLQTKPAHRTYKFDYTLPGGSLNVANKQLTLPTADLPLDEAGASFLTINDYIATAGECFIPQIPTDLHVVLAQRVACKCLEALGDSQGLANAKARLDEMEKVIGNLIDNRTESSPQKINNHHSPLQFGRYRRFLPTRF